MESLPESTRLRLGHLHCWRQEPAGPPQGPPLLLVHGFGGGVWGWANFQRFFAEAGYCSYAVELPGHGHDGLDSLGWCSLETYALYLAAALGDLGPCVVVGHSMGGLIAQKLAETHLQVGYVLLASAPPWHMFRRAYAPLWKLILRHPWRQIIRPITGAPVLLDPRLQDLLVNHRVPAGLRERIGGLDVPDSGRASMQMMAGLVSVDAARVRSPLLVVAGSDDRLIPAGEQRRLAEKYECPLQIYDRGHMLIIEDGWEDVAAGILNWVAALAPARALPDPAAEDRVDQAVAG